MSSRKRKDSTIPEFEGKSSKRTRLLSTLWNSQSKRTGSSEKSSITQLSPVYKIKAIIGERPAEYLIDWADDQVTGENFVPDWQPKANVSTAAIDAWKKRRASVPRSSNSRPRRQRRRKRRPASVRDRTATDVGVPKINSPFQLTSENSSRKSYSDSSQALRKALTSIDPSFDTSNLPRVAVQISQHSSLEKHLYTVYHSSSTTKEGSSSFRNHPDASLSGSLLKPETSSPIATQRNTIIPDSQSLPGSSSYVPTSSICTSVRDIIAADRSPSGVSTARHPHTLQVITSSNFESSVSHIESYPNIEVAASQLSVGRSPEIAIAATQPSIADSSFPSTSAVSANSRDYDNDSGKKSINNSPNYFKLSEETVQRHVTVSELLNTSKGPPSDSHPSQATTTDHSVRSLNDPNSQITQPILSQDREDHTRREFSSNPSRLISPATLDSQEPPLPPLTWDDEMSDFRPTDGKFAGDLQSLRTKEKLESMRAASASKKEAARKEQHSRPSSTRASPSSNTERELSHLSPQRASQVILSRELMQAISPITREPTQAFSQRENYKPLSSVGRSTPTLSYGPSQQPLHPATARRSSQQPLSPTTQSPAVWNDSQQSLAAAKITSPAQSGDQLSVSVQSPGLTQSRIRTDTPEIPNKMEYQTQEEPERLEVQPIWMSTELPLPMRSSQSVPHTPVTPSRLATHAEASPSQIMTLEPKNLGLREFVIPLCMQKRIMQQYVDTMSFYTSSITENMTKVRLSEKSISQLNVLLGRLANVSTHIGLEGGGPGSQDSVKPEQEAIYAELSSEKFKFLGSLFEVAKDDNLHIALIAKSGPLHDIVELFLKGRKVNYNRPATFSRSDPRTAHGRLQVSVLASGQGTGNPIEVARKADLVIALDETFNAKDSQVVDLRKDNIGGLAPVVRLIVYASVEHFDLCLPRTLEPIDRLRKLISCVWHTQSIVGELRDQEPNSQTCANIVATFLRGNTQASTWKLPNIQPLRNLPVMDSDSSLSNAMSDESNEVGRPSEITRKYWPCNPPVAAGNSFIGVVQPDNDHLPNGKRAFDLEHGDSLEIQTKKQRMARRAHAGLPLEEPHTVENLERWLAEGNAREHRLMRDIELWKNAADSHAKWAEMRQCDYECLRDKWSNLHHDKLDLKEEVASLTKKLEKTRLDRISLQGERGVLKKDLEECRQQLIGHSDPNIAEAAQKDARIRDLQEENVNLKKKVDLANGQLEYARGMYQDSSSRAVELALELEGLQKIFEPTKSQLDHEIRRRKDERETDPRAQQLELMLQENQTLRAEIEGKDRLIKKKEDQITVLERGRGAGVQTRGSSAQPRSPRAGGSRGASPAASLLGGAGGAGRGPSGLSGRVDIE